MTMDQHDLARIKLLSSRFLELQGLRVALAGSAIAVIVGCYLVFFTPTANGGLLSLGVAFLFMIPGQWWAHQYYTRTVGRQVREPRNPAYFFIFGIVYSLVAGYLNRRYPELPEGFPTLAVVTVASLIIVIRDWPWRAYYLITAVAPAYAFTTTALRGDVIDPGMTLAVTLFVTGLSMVVVGLLDHRLLMNGLRLTAHGLQDVSQRKP